MPVRAQEIFNKAYARWHMSRPTVVRHLRRGEREFLVLHNAGIANGRRFSVYTLNVKRLLPWDRDVLRESLSNESKWAIYFQERKKIGTKTNKDLEDFLRSETYSLVIGIEQMLFKARHQPNKEIAREVVEAAVDWVMRRWLGSLGEVMWVRKDDSGIALSDAMAPLIKVIERQDSKWRAASHSFNSRS
jgi:hypothetical protein